MICVEAGRKPQSRNLAASIKIPRRLQMALEASGNTNVLKNGEEKQKETHQWHTYP